VSHNGSSATGRYRVVIVGGGFAGLGCALRLADHEDVEVTLIDRNNYHQFQSLLYQVATSQLAPSDIAHSLRGVFPDQPNVDVKLAEINGVDTATRTVTTQDGETWSGDVLVLAAGSQPNFLHTPGAADNSFPLYSLDDATRLRSRIPACLRTSIAIRHLCSAARSTSSSWAGVRPALRLPARWAT
jgi:NADH dehydrogenase